MPLLNQMSAVSRVVPINPSIKSANITMLAVVVAGAGSYGSGNPTGSFQRPGSGGGGGVVGLVTIILQPTIATSLSLIVGANASANSQRGGNSSIITTGVGVGAAGYINLTAIGGGAGGNSLGQTQAPFYTSGGSGGTGGTGGGGGGTFSSTPQGAAGAGGAAIPFTSPGLYFGDNGAANTTYVQGFAGAPGSNAGVSQANQNGGAGGGAGTAGTSSYPSPAGFSTTAGAGRSVTIGGSARTVGGTPAGSYGAYAGPGGVIYLELPTSDTKRLSYSADGIGTNGSNTLLIFTSSSSTITVL
jgi:hypothetical protein